MEDYSLYNNLIERLMQLEPYYIFGLVIIGFLGNTISFAVFILSKKKSIKSNYNLASLALSDNGFLLSLLLVNLRHFSIDFFNKYVLVCKLTVYFTYVFGFLSAWFVVEFSVERVVVVYFPIKRHAICTSSRNKGVIALAVAAGLLIYSFSFVTSGLEIHNSLEACVPHEKWLNFVQLMSLIDTVIAIIIPFFIILIANTLIAAKLMKFPSPFKFCSKKNSPTLTSNSTISNLPVRPSEKLLKKKKSIVAFSPNDKLDSVSLSFKVTPININVSNMPNRIKNYSKTTKILFTISTTYLILHFPIAICKIWYFFKNTQLDDESSSDTALEANPIEEIIERITCYLYYLNFSLNFFLYSLNGSQFRESILGIFKKKDEYISRNSTIKRNRINSKITVL